MKKLLVLFISLLSISFTNAQEKQYEVKKILSPQYGKVPAGKTKITISDKVIVVDGGKKAVEYLVENIEETDYTTIYICKYGNQSDIRFTYYKNENYLRFENRDNFTGKVGELQYYFKD